MIPGIGTFIFSAKTDFAVENEEQAEIARCFSGLFTRAAGFTPQVKVGEEKYVSGPIREAYLNLSWTPDEATAFIGTDDEVAYEQFVLPANKHYRAPQARLADKVQIDIDPATGTLRSYIYIKVRRCWHRP